MERSREVDAPPAEGSLAAACGPGGAARGIEPASDEQIAFDVFAASVTGSLSRLAFARTGSRADAEDLVQDVLLDAHRRWEVIGRYDDPSAWARRAVLNKTVSRWRRRGRERDAMARWAGRRSGSVGDEVTFADEEL